MNIITNIGIYKIINIVTNSIYIGSSINLKERKHYHITKLRNDTHDNNHLQNAWNKYGEESFKFEIIEYLKFPINYNKKLQSEHIVCRELYYIYSLNPEYNIDKSDNQGNYIHVISEKTRKQRKENYKKNTNFINSKSKGNTGYRHSLKTRIKISKKKRNSNSLYSIGMYDEENNLLNRFICSSHASEITTIKSSTIRNNLCGISKSCRFNNTKVIFKNLYE